MPIAVKRRSPVKRKTSPKRRSPVKRKTSPKRRSPVKRKTKTSPKRMSPVKRRTSPKRRSPVKRKTSRKRLNPPPHQYVPFLNKQHFENAYALYARKQRTMYQTPMTKAMYLRMMKIQYKDKIEKRKKRASESRNVQEVMRRVREDQFQRVQNDALAQRLRDIRNPPSQRELAARQAADLRVARSLPSAPTGIIGIR